VLTEAEASSSIQPVYPRISRRRGEEGIVILSVEVLASGRTGNIGTVRSSGYPRLDKAAVDAARDTSFTPAQQGGRAVDSTTELSFTFRLTDD
jgi:protein TonB